MLLPCPVSCKSTTHGCCDDGYTPAGGSANEGCPTSLPYTLPPLLDCEESEFKCCPDGITASTGPQQAGCSEVTDDGCDASDFGCCLDGITAAHGVNFKDCPDGATYVFTCHDAPYGCCPDGVTEARGPNDAGCVSRSNKAGNAVFLLFILICWCQMLTWKRNSVLFCYERTEVVVNLQESYLDVGVVSR